MYYKETLICTANSSTKMLTDGAHLYRKGKKIPLIVKAHIEKIKKDQEKYYGKYYDVNDPVLHGYGFENIEWELEFTPFRNECGDFGENVYGRTYEIGFHLSCNYNDTLAVHTIDHWFGSKSENQQGNSDWMVGFILGLEVNGKFVAFEDMNWCRIHKNLLKSN